MGVAEKREKSNRQRTFPVFHRVFHSGYVNETHRNGMNNAKKTEYYQVYKFIMLPQAIYLLSEAAGRVG